MNRQRDFEKAIGQAEAALSNAKGYFDDESTEASELRGRISQLEDENRDLQSLVKALEFEISEATKS